MLDSKLLPPPLPNAYVARDRLSNELTLGVTNRPLTLVSATAGFGKTVVATSWAASAGVGRSIAWIRAEETDDRLATFWAYAVEGFARSGVSLPHVSRPLREDDADSAFLAWLATDLLQHPEPVVLILDDADRLTNLEVLNGLDFLLTHAAPRFRLVMCCRADPVLPLHRYRLAESMMEIRADALAFTEREADQLLTGHGVPLASDATAALTARTGGWVAGLRLAAMALAHSMDDTTLLDSLERTDATLAEYLMTEVVDAQGPELRDILLRASVARDLWPDLVDELTGRSGGALALAAFDHANVFLERDARATGGRRIHPLLREILQAQLAYESPRLVPELHRRCASWLAAAGQLPVAVNHAVLAGDRAYAAALLVDGLAAASLLLAPDIGDYASIVEALPVSTPGANVALVRAALALGKRDVTAALDHLAHAVELGKLTSQTVQFRFTEAMLRAMLCAETADISGAIEATAEGERLLTLLPARLAAAHPELRAVLLLSLGTAQLWQGDAETAERTLTDALAASTAPSVSSLRIQCTGRLALVHAVRGRLGRAREYGHAAHAMATEAGLSPHNESTAAALALGWVYAQQYHDEQSRRWLARAEQSSNEAERRLLAPMVAVLRARLEARGGVSAVGLLAPFDAPSLAIPWMREHLVAQAADLHLARGRPDLAMQVIAALPEPHPPRVRITLNRLRSADDRFPSVPAELLHDAGASLDAQVAAWLDQGSFHLARQQEDPAAQAIEHALRLAEPEQMRRPFVECAPRIREVLRTGIPRHATGWLHGPRSAAPVGSRMKPSGSSGSGAQAASARPTVQERLTERELEVLAHLSELLSTSEIGVTMFVSVNTVRTHVRSILRKLDVSGRSEAVRRAWEMNLL